MPGYVYVLTNPLMPGIVKIGCTSRRDIGARMRELFGTNTTGTPAEFELAMAFECGDAEDAENVEKAFHRLLDGARTHPKREFFYVDDPEDIRPFLERFGRETDVDGYTDDDGKRPPKQGDTTRTPPFNFCKMGIPLGGVLRCDATGAEVKVVAPKKVKLGRERISISAATDEAGKWPPGLHWSYEGRPLNDIRDEVLASGSWHEADCTGYEADSADPTDEPQDSADELDSLTNGV